MDEDDLIFAAEDEAGAETGLPWLVLVVDDEPDVHAVTRLTLEKERFGERPVRLLYASSGAEGRRLLAEHPGIALVLLDVVMESDEAGLLFVRHVREELGNRRLRIVLRTGQPGIAPPREIVQRYQIDDYRTKTELTSERLYVSVAAALRSFALLEEQAQRERELLLSNQELERFAYVASHDLQTPLRAIVGYTQLLQRRYASSLPPDGVILIDSVADSGKRLSELIRSLLEFSDLGQRQRAWQAISLETLLARACDRLRGQIAERGAEIEAGPLPIVQGDPVMLEQALLVLLDNALKFQPGPRPWVGVSSAEVDGQVELRVQDHGIGIDPLHLPKVLEGFHRLHTQDDYPGTGLGLAICRKVMRLHDGALRAESTPAQGSTFSLRFPSAPR